MYQNPYETLSGKITIPAVKSAGFQELQFDTGEVRLNYVVGPNNGDPLVLIPAQIGMWESYEKVMVPLAKHFQVYVLDIRGHGKSSWTPGDYSWESIGRDMRAFLERVVRRPAIIAGNSSGGIISLWCGAHLPQYVKAVILEDTPVFSVEMPRFKVEDRFVYNGLKRLVDNIGNVHNRNVAEYFRGMKVPISDKRSKQIPNWYINYLLKKVSYFEEKYPFHPIEVGFPTTLRLLLKSLSMFDPDFARAFVDGRFYGNMNHEQALRKISCPLLVMHADWKRYPEHGLVGAMDDNDARRIQELVPHAQYVRIPANHVIHAFRPKRYVAEVLQFIELL